MPAFALADATDMSVPGPDYVLDLSTPVPSVAGDEHATEPAKSAGRPWLAIHWKCCSVYSRVYRQPDAKAYEGRCPRCGRPLKVGISPTGTSNRLFEAF